MSTSRGIPGIASIKERLRISGQKRVFVVVGGIGPFSHTCFEQNLLRANEVATSDQNHPGYLLLNETPFPDRTYALKEEAEGRPELAQEIEQRIIDDACWSAAQGCDFIVFICNTIHNWYERVEERLPIPWLHLMRVTTQQIKKQHVDVEKVGILATDGTLMGKLYHDALERVGLEPVAPEVGHPVQKRVMTAIYDENYGIKATGDTVSERAKDNLIKATEWLKREGAQAVIAGCTEISVALTPKVYHRLPIIDPLEALARVTVDLAMGAGEIQ